MDSRGTRTVCGPHARKKRAMLDAAEPASATEWLKAACVQLGTPSGDVLRCSPPRNAGSCVTRSRREIEHLDRTVPEQACVPLRHALVVTPCLHTCLAAPVARACLSLPELA